MNERSFITDAMNPDSPPLSKGERTRQAVLAAAHNLFLEHGFHATSMRQIANRADMAVGGIYNHFASKEAIFDVLILEKHPYQQIIPILQSAPGDTLEEFARNAACNMVAELNQRPDFLKLIFIEIIEFNGSHLPLLHQTVYSQVAPLLERFNLPDNRLREIPMPVILRSFIGLIFSYYIIQYMTGPVHISWMKGGANMGQFVDIFLNGILKPAETA